MKGKLMNTNLFNDVCISESIVKQRQLNFNTVHLQGYKI
jgi:hypothetical protein